MRKEKNEKIRDDLIIRKRKRLGGYEVIYPLKNEDGSWNKKNIKIHIKEQLWGLVQILLPFLILLYLLLPGAQEIKENCEAYIEDLQDNACELCTLQKSGNYNAFPVDLGNFSIQGEKE